MEKLERYSKILLAGLLALGLLYALLKLTGLITSAVLLGLGATVLFYMLKTVGGLARRCF